jgi:ABC-type branched-subunit amino acid transport system substrate-binding protein
MKAEKLFEKKNYNQALDKYREYLEHFSDKEMAPAALIKIGTIEAILEHYSESINSYKRLIREYPESIFVDDAMVASLRVYYREGKYQEVIDFADQALKKTVSKEHILNIYIILGDTYIAQENLVLAVYYYTLAYGKADPLTKKSILIKLQEGLKPLRYTEIEMVLELIDDKHLEGLFLYLAGMLKAEEEYYYDDAKRILSEFIEKFPDHEKAGIASEQLKKLESLSFYEHHTIGCLLPLSGYYKVYGNRALHGIQLALNKFIAQNTNQDTKKLIKISIKDTGSTPDKAIAAIEEFYQEGVAAIIGPIFSVEAAAIEAQNKGIPIITITQKDNITETGDFVFRNFFTPQMQVKAIVSFAVEKLGVNRFAILYPDEKYGKTFMNLFWDEVIASGGIVTGLESYGLGKTDFSAPIKKLVGLYYEIPEDLLKEKGKDKLIDDDNILYTDKKPEPVIDFDALFIPDGPKRAGLIMPQLAYNDIEDVYIFGTNLWHSDRLIEMAHKYVQDAVMPDLFFAGSSSEHVQDFVKSFKDSFKKKPGFIEAIAYDTAMILFGIISRSDVSFRSTIKKELTRMEGFDGITGHTRFTKNGDVEKRLYLLTIKGKKFIEIMPIHK